MRANVDGKHFQASQAEPLGVYNRHQSCWSPFSPFVPIIVSTLTPTWPSGSECKSTWQRNHQDPPNWHFLGYDSMDYRRAGCSPTLALTSYIGFQNLSLFVLWVWCYSLMLCRICTLSFQGKLEALSHFRKSSAWSYPGTGIETGFSCDSST